MGDIVDGIHIDELCANCGNRWGRHASIGDLCPPFKPHDYKNPHAPRWRHPGIMTITHETTKKPVE